MSRKIFTFLILVLGVCWASPLLAGTVFLKNQYIIQGKIKELDDQKLVIAWRNGSMTIYRRFIEDYILDPVEEEAFRQAAERQALEGVEEWVETTVHGDLVLPESLDELIAMHGNASLQTPTPGASGNPSSSGGVEPIDPLSQITQVPPPVSDSRLEVVLSTFGVALIPPPEWIVIEENGGVSIRKVASSPLPALTVQVSAPNSMALLHAEQELRQTLSTKYPGFEIIGEHQEQIGFERAFVVEGESSELELHFVQVLVRHENLFYLIGLQQRTPVDSGEHSALERMLHTLRFVD